MAKIMERINLPLLAMGAGVTLISVTTVSTLYLNYRMSRRLERELSNLIVAVTDLRREIIDLKLTNRRRLGHGSSVSDETDVYYDFSDEGEEESNIFNGLSTFATDEENLRTIDVILDSLNNKPDICHTVYTRIASLKEKFFNNVNYLWRFAKTCHVCAIIAGENGDTEKKKELCYEALRQATQALALTDDDANVHKWYAITIGSCADFECIQNKIKFGFAFKEHTEIALRLNPNDESLHHLMGRWSYQVATLPWIERKLATTFYGQLPTSTLAEARSHFMKASKLRTNSIWKENHLFIAKTYLGENNFQAAIRYLDDAHDNETVEKTDLIILHELESLRNKYASYRD